MKHADPLRADTLGTAPLSQAIEAHHHGKEREAHRQSLSSVPGDTVVEAPEKVVDLEINSVDNDKEHHRAPTRDEIQTLRKVPGSIPATAYLLCFVDFAERASWFGARSVSSNFMQFPLPEGGNGAGAPPSGSELPAGALGHGQRFSVALGLVFSFLSYVIPIFGAWLAEAKVGRYRTILIGVLIGGVAHIIMIAGAVPSILQAGKGTAPFLVSLFLLALGAGLFRPNVSPTVLDQHRHYQPFVKELPSGENVIIDPEATMQRIMLIFYALINVGAFYSLATVYSEKLVGYWLAFLLPGIIYLLLPLMLWYLNDKLIKVPPDGGALTKFWKILTVSLVENKGMVWKKGFFDRVQPGALLQKYPSSGPVKWTSKDVEDVKRTLVACEIFLYFPIYHLNDGGVGTILPSQGAAMLKKGVPNDLLGNFNPITIMITVPVLTYIVYPALRKSNIKFGRISRITLGFWLAVISGLVSSLVQWRIYKTSPCGYHATTCPEVAPVSIWWQLPSYVLGALSECFSNVTGYELAYARSPPGMRSLVVSLFLFSTALSSALGLILTPAIVDPHLVWVWAGPTIALAVQTVIFWVRHRKYNDDEFMIEGDE
uniref:MFS-type transporter ucsM n=1 Tax=Acremonium sp. TaxID=2046025 RepID=UCSM_ACRSP|nr:RecName: Full=MFS-type transporter ucsM; AltName: Full=UCS1025A pyrrolizidinone biosynthesis cluster protein M [Acremonium sp.]QBC88157.1 UcsM [Acremonium sp.]